MSDDDLKNRLRSVGASQLSDAELLELLGLTPVQAKELLDVTSSLRTLSRLGIGGISANAGVGDAKAIRLVAAIELGRRAFAIPPAVASRISTSHDIVALLAPRIRDSDIEHFMVVPLDARNRPISVIEVSRGSITACPVAPADVFRAIVCEAAPAVVFVHNHPSGDPQPSPEDIALTDRLVTASRLLGVHVVDHVIIAREGHFSFLDAGLLARRPPKAAMSIAAT